MIKLKKISEYEWEIPKEGEMKVPARIFASEKLIKDIQQDKTLEQAKNVAKLPGIIKVGLTMPDAHQGYGFPIGGVAAFDLEKGVISPGGVGYDINCSVRLLKTNLTLKDIKGKEIKIRDILFEDLPTGVGEDGPMKLNDKELDEVLINGAQQAVKMGYGTKEDYLHTEDLGKLPNANPSAVSPRAKKRGRTQLGTVGSGNHFVDVFAVEQIFNEKVAEKFQLEKDQIVIMIHCGSRGLGHQVAGDYIELMGKQYGYPKFDRELVNAPIQSELGKKYLGAMAAAANFGFANKQVLTHMIRETMKKIFPKFKAEVIYDICHNIAKFETHNIDGKNKEVLIMRKGATRSFGPGRKEIPEVYRSVGQPVIIPGSMGTPSYILVGTKKAEEISFGSTAHGSGRVMSRSGAKLKFKGEEIKNQLEKQGIFVKSQSWSSLTEEAPGVYKDSEEVVRVSHNLGIGNLVAKLRPIVVVIG